MALVVVCAYLFVFYMLQTRQDEMIFPSYGPAFEDCKEINALGAKAVDIWRGTQRVRYLLLEGKHAKGWIILYHGNGGSVCYRTWHAQNLQSDDWNVAMAEYPGYGGDGNKPTQSLLMENSLAVYDAIFETAKGLPIIVFGKSLGSGFATYVASKRPITALILHTPYPSINAIALRNFFYLFPFPLMNRNPIPAELWAPDVKCPVLALHGDADKLIRYSLGQRQAANFRVPVEFVTVPGADHNDLAFRNKDLYWGSILDFIKKTLNPPKST